MTERILNMTTQEIFLTKPIVEPEMVFVQGGMFMMGATPKQGDDCEDDEK